MIEMNRAWAFRHPEKEVPFETLKGKALKSVDVLYGHGDGDRIVFDTGCGRTYVMGHMQDCCEVVDVEAISGSLSKLCMPSLDADGYKLSMAESVSSKNGEPKPDMETTGHHDQWTWTFYKLGNINGYATIRWIGASNGCYSEEVGFYDVTDDEESNNG